VSIQKISESGLNLSHKANEKIKELQEYIKSIVVLIAKISEASQGQSLEANNINSAIQQISINVNITTQLAEKLDAAINSLTVDS
jgi:methyl-accepting chemotaxis protein